MACKFKVGDRVEIVRDDMDGFPSDFKKGHRGKVIAIGRGTGYPYEIQRNGGHTDSFDARELKLIKRKGNK